MHYSYSNDCFATSYNREVICNDVVVIHPRYLLHFVQRNPNAIARSNEVFFDREGVHRLQLGLGHDPTVLFGVLDCVVLLSSCEDDEARPKSFPIP